MLILREATITRDWPANRLREVTITQGSTACVLRPSS